MILTKKKLLSITVVFGLFLIIFISFIIFYNNFTDKKFAHIIQTTDTFINDNSFKKAEELLKSAVERVNSPLDYMIILKRIYRLDNLKLLSEISKEAHREYPKDKVILEIYIYSLLKTGETETAQTVLKNIKKINLSEELVLEVTIKSGAEFPDDNIFYQGLNENNISVFNNLYRVTKDNNFLINSVLLNLEKGNYKQAELRTGDINTETLENKKLLLLTKYSNKNYKDVLDMIRVYDFGYSVEELLLIGIDIDIKMELYEEVANKIYNFIGLYPHFSVIPYINLIYLDSLVNIQDIDKYINLGLTYYPYNRLLNLILADYYVSNKNEISALDIVTKFLKYNTEDKEFEILYKQLKGTSYPEQFINNIYELVNFNPNNQDTAKYLAWSLFENRDFDKLENLLLNEEYTDTGWHHFFNAILYTRNDENTIAMDYFQSAFKMDNTWEALFNSGLISEHMNDYQNAVKFYQSAENMLISTSENKITKSVIRTALASQFYKMNDQDNAYREIRNALDLDSSNMKAHLLLKKLESTHY